MSEDMKFYEDLLIKFLYIKKSVREKIIPILSPDIFDRDENKEIVNHMLAFLDKYDKFPKAHESLLKLKEKHRTHLRDVVMMIDSDKYDDDLLLDELEMLIRGKMISNVCYSTILSLDDDDDDKKEKFDAPDKLREAFAFSFDQKIGLDLFNSEDRMYDFLHEKKHIVPTNIQKFNEEIDGGIHNKSLTLFLAETNMGKSLVMSSLAVGNVLANKNVLYISCELSENKTGERMLANVWDIPMNDLKAIPKNRFHRKYEELKNNFQKRVVVREYPPKAINANTIRNLLKELELKKFIPDIIYIDQIGNMNSNYRVRADSTYTEMGRVTQEVRGVAIEYDKPIVSAIQTNRSGFGSSEIDLTNTGDSLGFVQTADIVVAITQSEELRNQGKFIWSILKNRYGINKTKITVNVIFEKMKVYDDEDAITEKQYGDEKLPETTNEKKEKIKNAMSMIDNIENKDFTKKEKKIIDWE